RTRYSGFVRTAKLAKRAPAPGPRRLRARFHPRPLEARAAVHRPLVARDERHCRLRAAGRADHGVHLARLTAQSLAAPRGSALRAALGLVHESLLGEERLLAGREYKVDPALTAFEVLVLEVHVPGPPP